MPLLKSLKNLTAPDLVKQWKTLINQNVMMGRDSHLIKVKLEYMTPAQILLGMYQYKGQRTVTIPQFLAEEEDWYIQDETEASIELAVCVSHTYPPAYWTWHDCRYEQNYYAFQAASQALRELREWSDRILE